MQSLRYHLEKHGNGRTYLEYVTDGKNFFETNKDKAVELTLKNGQAGYSIKLKNNGTRSGGFWTKDGKMITFWGDN